MFNSDNTFWFYGNTSIRWECKCGNNSLKVWNGNTLKELDKESALIKILIQNQENSLLIFPSCIQEDISKELNNLKEKI